MTKRSLDKLRAELRKTDAELVNLLNERAELSIAVGKLKAKNGWDIYDPSQESRVCDYLKELNGGPLPSKSLQRIFREIISASRSLQAPVTAAYLGPEATFSHLAAQSHFGKDTIFLPQGSIYQVFNEVEKGKADWGVVPVENSLEGSVNLTLDRLIATPLSIRAEIFLRISHCLMASKKNMAKIRKIYSHPHVFGQCQGWLRANLPGYQRIEMESTTAAAKAAADDPLGAAIGSVLAAEKYGLHIVADGIEDNPSNTTRFLVIGEGKSKATGNDKTTILFATRHAPGSLYHALKPFAERKINLVKIESFPVKERLWEYLFFADAAGHIDDDKIKGCLADLKKETTFLKVLGSYPRGEGQ
ncbi:MAG: prephenate dehydratase [Smithellaceae bacterium]|nr:prephenate dehydratase [Smithellaceae bacterium]